MNAVAKPRRYESSEEDDDPEDGDADADTDVDTNPLASPSSSFTTQPTQLLLGRPTRQPTQPTQILPRGPNQKPGPPRRSPSALASGQENMSSLASAPIVSSPASRNAELVEVPASSPVQSAADHTKEPPSLGSRLAPAGTQFRPPRRPEQPAMLKRPAPDPVVLSSDGEDDPLPRRGDIVPTNFAKKISIYNYDTAKAGKPNAFDTIMKVGDRATSSARKDDADHQAPTKRQVHDPPPAVPKRKRLVQGLAPRTHSSASSQSQEAQGAEPTKNPGKKLMRGLPPRDAPVSSQWQEPAPSSPSSADPILLSDDDDQDVYRYVAVKKEEGGSHNQVLDCLNTSSIEDLAAMTKMDKTVLKAMMEKRPFRTLSKARSVIASKKSGSHKSQKIQLGESVVDNVTEYLEATNAIDEIVADCEAKAKLVKQEMGNWDMDMFGKRPDGDGQMLTPNSTGAGTGAGQQKCLPIPTQPRLMDGHCEMKTFQLFGLNWMHTLYKSKFGSILADEMGLGKTCQVISLMCQLVQDGEMDDRQAWPNLIVVPPSTYENWLAEFERFAPGLQVAGYQGSQAVRRQIAREILDSPEDYHVVLTTYTQMTLEDDIDAMRELKINVAVFDEGHKMKNPKTKAYKELIRITAKWRLLLTGTPIQNNLLEMISLLSFINPRMFNQHTEHIKFLFSQKITARDAGNGAFLYSERVKRAKTILEPFILQRQKHQVVEMAKKTRGVIYCDLTGKQRSRYDELESLFRSAKPKARAAGRQNDQNNTWMQLRKAALHPQLFRKIYTNDKLSRMAKILMANVPQAELQQPSLKYLTEELSNSSDFEIGLWCRDYGCIADFAMEPDLLAASSGKVLKLLEMIRQYETDGDRVLVFSRFSKMIEILHEALTIRGIKHCKLSGQTDVSERQDLIDEFNGDDTIPVFLLTTAAGGTGINLTAANKVVIFDQSDNPQDDIQAENRAHRFGQRRDVEIIRLIARDTVEELIYKACEKKIELANKVTGAEEDLAGGKKLEVEVRRMMTQRLTP